jgi:signal transduction histidine kinase
VLPAEIRHDLFLAVKEALNNVLKHAQASEVCIAITKTAAVLEIVVQDNGRGFETGETSALGGGNGLDNMRKRMAKIGGGCCLTSAPSQGTKLQFTVRVNAGTSYNRTN